MTECGLVVGEDRQHGLISDVVSSRHGVGRGDPDKAGPGRQFRSFHGTSLRVRAGRRDPQAARVPTGPMDGDRRSGRGLTGIRSYLYGPYTEASGRLTKPAGACLTGGLFVGVPQLDITPGIRADAHLVQRLMRSNYSSWQKDVVRRKVIRSLAAVTPDLVLDLDGGGRSGEAMVAAGLSVLSVEDGRWAKRLGVAEYRVQRSLEVCCVETGRTPAWGEAVLFAPRADAAFLDFMNHWSEENRQTLIACRHMKAVAVTLMFERLPVGQKLLNEEWVALYTGLLEWATGMRVRWSHVYLRDRNLKAGVFFLRRENRKRQTPRECATCSVPLVSSAARFCRSCLKSRKRSPESLERDRERSRDYYERNREQLLERQRLKRQKFPEQIRAEKRADYLKHREEILARQKLKRQATFVPLSKEERSARAKAGAALRNRRRMEGAAVSGTAAEAISMDEAA
jgi:hypothetical protein